jgi:hypothetical protein
MSSQPATIDVLAEPRWSLNHDDYHAAVDDHIDTTRRMRDHRRVADELRPVVDELLGDVTYATVGERASQVRQAIGRVRDLADQTFATVDATRVDDSVALGARRRRIAEAVETGDQGVTAAIDGARATVLVHRAELELEALGRVDPRREPMARADAEVTLGGRTDVEALQQLARDPDPDVRALVAGPWGYRRVRSQARSDEAAQELHKAVRDIALVTAAKVGDDRQRRAVQGIKALDEASRAIDAVRSYASILLGAVR